VTRTQIVRFAGAAGDFNPMHHDEPFAQAAGEPSVFAMGQLTAAILGAFVARWLGRDRISSFGVRFKDKVRPGDALVLRGRRGDDGRYELEALRQDDGAVVLTGWAVTS
jgi:acyl dehydratase